MAAQANRRDHRWIAGHVYFVRGDRLIKIGVSTESLCRRVLALRAQCETSLSVIGFFAVHGSYRKLRTAERSAHRHFTTRRHHQEWFAISEAEAREYVLARRGRLGEPDASTRGEQPRGTTAQIAAQRIDDSRYFVDGKADDLMSAPELAHDYGIHVETIRRWIRKGVLPFVKVGPHRLKRVRRSEFERLGSDVRHI